MKHLGERSTLAYEADACPRPVKSLNRRFSWRAVFARVRKLAPDSVNDAGSFQVAGGHYRDTRYRPGTTHCDFAGRVTAQRNFTADNGGDPDDASDCQGHGTNVAGIICAAGIHPGIAPGARIIPLKVLDNSGGGSFANIAAALQWVIENHAAYEISAVCLALADGGNHRSDAPFTNDPVGDRIRSLAGLGIACCVHAGDDYYTHGSAQGMKLSGDLPGNAQTWVGSTTAPRRSHHPTGAEAFETRAASSLPSRSGHEKATQMRHGLSRRRANDASGS